MSGLKIPRCRYHPSREGIAHYGKGKGIYSLCSECFAKRLGGLERIPLDEHGARCHDLDEAAEAARDAEG